MSTWSTFKLDPALMPGGSAADSSSSAAAGPLIGHGQVLVDPALQALEQVVNDVRRGKVKLADLERERQHEHDSEQIPQGQGHDTVGAGAGDTGLGVGMMDEEFDPALREIVNSLTNAQQSSGLLGTNLTQAQAQAAIDAHLSEETDHGMALKTLEDLERAGFGMLESQFGSHGNEHEHDPFGITDTAHHPQPHAETSASGAAAAAAAAAAHQNDISLSREPRRRGRPKGSKNKPKPGQPAPAPPPPKIPKKRGRPPKVFTPEELAEIEARKAEKKAAAAGGGSAGSGSGRRKGRPRKFPGYLVREMRLKKNRTEYRELIRNYQDPPHPHHHDHDQEMDHENEHEHQGDGGGFWTDGMEQDILAAVEGLDEGHDHGDGRLGARGEADNLHAHEHEHENENDVPSSRAFEQEGGEMEMRRVFGLPAEHEEQHHHGGQVE